MKVKKLRPSIHHMEIFMGIIEYAYDSVQNLLEAIAIGIGTNKKVILGEVIYFMNLTGKYSYQINSRRRSRHRQHLPIKKLPPIHRKISNKTRHLLGMHRRLEARKGLRQHFCLNSAQAPRH
jgi:hypothetical protein